MRFFLISFLFHLSLAAGLWWPHRAVVEDKKTKSFTKIQLRDKKAESKKKLAASLSSKTQLESGPIPRGKEKGVRYEDLLIKPGEQGAVIAEPKGVAWSRHPYHGKRFHEIHADGIQVSGAIDIPLKFRDMLGNGKAILKLRRQGKEVYVEYLEGEAYLRAAVWEAITEPQSQARLENLFIQMASDEVLIVVKTVKSKKYMMGQSFDQKLEVSKNKLTITHISYIPPGGTGVNPLKGGIGMSLTLPDEDADKAVERDQMHMRRLSRLEAFHIIIKNRLLFVGKEAVK